MFFFGATETRACVMRGIELSASDGQRENEDAFCSIQSRFKQTKHGSEENGYCENLALCYDTHRLKTLIPFLAKSKCIVKRSIFVFLHHVFIALEVRNGVLFLRNVAYSTKTAMAEGMCVLVLGTYAATSWLMARSSRTFSSSACGW